ncbi:hypothetical protein B0J13DRAFT_281930 [Dactylonectria estremocensis]|uniref:Uncharacterized protein n=1 Tax=Dactylonectria estremocensis TaxID=1079267 RepID=A0A9P9F1I0_9HYPO|nr:hypothetical protein B0J13DRAFT_281930 [Dactylonectria estremocensis]
MDHGWVALPCLMEEGETRRAKRLSAASEAMMESVGGRTRGGNPLEAKRNGAAAKPATRLPLHFPRPRSAFSVLGLGGRPGSELRQLARPSPERYPKIPRYPPTLRDATYTCQTCDGSERLLASPQGPEMASSRANLGDGDKQGARVRTPPEAKRCYLGNPCCKQLHSACLVFTLTIPLRSPRFASKPFAARHLPSDNGASSGRHAADIAARSSLLRVASGASHLFVDGFKMATARARPRNPKQRKPHSKLDGSLVLFQREDLFSRTTHLR